MQRKSVFWLSFVSLLALLLSACGGTDPAQGEGPGLSITPQSANQELANALSSMEQLRTVQFVVTGSSETSLGNETVTLGSNKMTFSGSGQKKIPEIISRVEMKVAVSLSGQNLIYTQINTPQQTYLQSTKKSGWYVLSRENAQNSSNLLIPGYDVNFLALAELSKNAQVEKLENVDLSGSNVQHFRLQLKAEQFADFLKATNQGSFSATPLILPKIDIWIKPDTHQVVRIQNVYTVTLNSNQQLTRTSYDTVINYGQFNEPITIDIPSDATPVNDIFSVFQ